MLSLATSGSCYQAQVRAFCDEAFIVCADAIAISGGFLGAAIPKTADIKSSYDPRNIRFEMSPILGDPAFAVFPLAVRVSSQLQRYE